MTGGYTMKEKNIQELAIRMGLISVEDMCQYTITQLVVKIANKVNELVDEVWRFESDVQEILKTQNENIQYLLGEGLHIEVGNIFDGWVQDGTFDTLINQSALKKVNDRIDETNAQLSQLTKSKEQITLNVMDFGAKGDGVTDDSEAIQMCIDFMKVVNDNTTLPVNCKKITFPCGVYGISKPITMTTNAIIDFNNSQIVALNEMEYMWTFRSDIQLPGVIFNDMVLHGKGLVNKGLWIKDVTNFTINRIRTFSFKTHHIYADKSGRSGQCHFIINTGELLGGINPNAGGYINTVDSVGLEVRTTDCIIRDLTTRDFKKHINNLSGINFYDHCHGWNQYGSIMTDSTHFTIGWDAKILNSYSDTVTNAFDLKGNGRVEVIAHTCFTNKEFYDDSTHGTVKVMKLTKADRVDKMCFVGCRFDANGVQTQICDNANYAKYCEFVACTSNYSANGYVVVSPLNIAKPSGVSAWSWNVKKLSYNHIQMIVHGDLNKDVVNAKNPTTTLFTMPSETYNAYYATPIYVSITEYGASGNGVVCCGEINDKGVVSVNLKNIPFVATSNCKYSINADYLITY